MTKVIDLDSRRPEEEFYVVLALCLPCSHRWIGAVDVKTSLFKLECPVCGEFDSFAAFVPQAYQDELLDAAGKKVEHEPE